MDHYEIQEYPNYIEGENKYLLNVKMCLQHIA